MKELKKILLIFLIFVANLAFAEKPVSHFGNKPEFFLFATKLEKGNLNLNIKPRNDGQAWEYYNSIKIFKFDKTTATYYKNDLNASNKPKVETKLKVFIKKAGKDIDTQYFEIKFNILDNPTIPNDILKVSSSIGIEEKIKKEIKYDNKQPGGDYIKSVVITNIPNSGKGTVNIKITNKYNQVIDLTKEVQIELNFEELDKVITNFEKVKESKAYKDGDAIKINSYNNAINKAKNIDRNNTTQNEVDDIVSEVESTLAELLKLDKESLNDLITKSDEVKKSARYINSIPENKKIYDDLIEKAKKLDDLNTSNKEIKELVEKIKEAEKNLDGKLNTSKLDELISEENEIKSYKAYKKASKDKKDAYTKLIQEAKKIDKNTITQDKVNELIKKIEAAKKALGITLEKYVKYIDAFEYDDTSIIDYVDNDIYIVPKLGYYNVLNRIQNKDKLVGSVQIGVSHSLPTKKDLKLGGFFEYDRQIANNYAVGLTLKYRNVKAFTRYRLAEYNKKLNHNLDIYVEYKNKFNISDNFYLEPRINTFFNFSGKVKLDENVYLDNRIAMNYKVGLKMAYTKNNLLVFVEPDFVLGFKQQGLYKEGENKKEFYGAKSYIAANVNLGVEYKFKKGVKILMHNIFSANNSISLKYETKFGIGYDF
ncbi:coiled-coil domain-containing protein [Oceanivirga salmonicida]|uniref:coiled-coil domain-containing protein n=1 Tax=Oceanivirga salmonicida TaxID=1769291 RepID=UPI0012E185FF|nr:FIVAR domain-containing protein [Oceanivirga salmonicida]